MDIQTLSISCVFSIDLALDIDVVAITRLYYQYVLLIGHSRLVLVIRVEISDL